jgi:Uma2 family endonuclease
LQKTNRWFTFIKKSEIIMMTIATEDFFQKPMTAAEYLKMQHAGGREDAPKYEFVNQKLILMAGASQNHNQINTNLSTLLNIEAWGKNTKHRVFANDMRVISYVPIKNYFYPDIVVVDGKPYMDDDGYKETLLNPTIIFEILSKGTEVLDRSEKLKSYLQTKSLKEYVLVNQYESCLEHFYRDESGNWVVQVSITEGVFKLKSAPIELKITDVYRYVDFNDPMATKDPDEITQEN